MHLKTEQSTKAVQIFLVVKIIVTVLQKADTNVDAKWVFLIKT